MGKSGPLSLAYVAVVPDFSSPPLALRSAAPRRWRASWQLSSLVHLAACGIVAAEICFSLLPPLDTSGSGRRRTIELEGQFPQAAAAAQPALLEALPIDVDPAREAAARDAQAMDDWASAIADPRLMDLFADEGDQSEAGRSRAAEFVQSRVLAAVAEAEQHSRDEQFERLRRLTGRLNDVATHQSVDELAAKFQKWLGTEQRAQAPSAATAGEFDLDTAQLHDVRREANPDGSYAYTSILVDAAGRQMETAMSEAEGENLYRIMELIKANPLLERVYRSVVMSLLDKLTRPM